MGVGDFLKGLIPFGTALLGGAAGSKGQKQSSSNTYVGMDPRLYQFNPQEREGINSAELGLVGELLGQMPGGGAYWGGGGGGMFSGGGGGHASAGHASASLIDPSSWVYQMEAPEAWMSGILSRGKEYLGSATENALRLQRDQAVRSGMSTSSPAYAYMVALQRRTEQEKLANALRDAKLAWTLPAAEREAGRLGQNAQMGTNVSMTNAQLATQASIANGQLAEAAAARRAQAAQFGASFARQGYNDLFQMLHTMSQPNASYHYLQTGGQQSSGGGLQGALLGGMAGFNVGQYMQQALGGGASTPGDLTGNNGGWGGVGTPVFSPQSGYPQQMQTMGMPDYFPDWGGGSSGYQQGPPNYYTPY